MLPTVCGCPAAAPACASDRSPMPASLLVIQWRTSNTSSFFRPASSNSNVATRVFGVSWSSSNMKCPPVELMRVGYFTPSAMRAACN
jgi:hypothetical protein